MDIKRVLVRAGVVFAVAVMAGCQNPGKVDSNRGSFTDDRDSKKYTTVKIGDQTWMAENLNYSMDGSWCQSCGTYGRYYTWNAAVSACPGGWRLPDASDWDQLISETDNAATAGKKLKSKMSWESYNGLSGGGTDSYGFKALPSGYHPSSGSVREVGYYGYWWSATESGGEAYSRIMGYIYSDVKVGSGNKESGYSVRCILIED